MSILLPDRTPDAPGGAEGRRWLPGIALGVIVIMGLVLRLIPLPQFVTSEHVYFFGADPYDHMRRVFLILAHFPSVPTLNYYQGFPEGSALIFSPLYHLLMAATAKVLGLGIPSERLVNMVGVLTPACLGAVTAIPVYLLLREFAGRGSALAGVLIFTLLPAHVFYSFVGQTDNNVTEPLAAAIYFWLVLRSVKSGRQGLSLALLAAGAGVAALFLWRGSTLFWAVSFFTLAATALACSTDRAALSRVLSRGAVLFVGKGVLLLLMMWGGVFAVKDVIRFHEISLFHALAALGFGGGFALSRAAAGVLARMPPVRSVPAAVLCFMLPVSLTVILTPSLLDELSRAYEYMGRGDVWREDIVEYASIVLQGGSFSFWRPVRVLSLLFWLLPVGMIWAVSRLIASRREALEMCFFASAGAIFFVSTLSRARFQHLLALVVALLAVIILDAAVRNLRKKRDRAIAWVLVAAALSPVIPTLSAYAAPPGGLIKGQKNIFTVMDWIRTHTPPTSHWNEPWVRPEYGIMAEWSFGSWIENVARRPAVATPFGDEIHGLEECLAFFLAESEQEALSTLRRNRVRYVIVSNIIPSLDTYRRIAGLLGEPHVRLVEREHGRAIWKPGRRYYRLLSTSLFLNNGIPFRNGPVPLLRTRHFRLLYESISELEQTGLPRPVKRHKVFEVVPGARVTIQAEAGTDVQVDLPLMTNTARMISYHDNATTNETGLATLILPYSTNTKAGTTTATGPYVLRAGDRTASLHLEEDMVVSGRDVFLDLRTPGHSIPTS